MATHNNKTGCARIGDNNNDILNAISMIHPESVTSTIPRVDEFFFLHFGLDASVLPLRHGVFVPSDHAHKYTVPLAVFCTPPTGWRVMPHGSSA